ncbi:MULTISPECIES: hypothetical protein [Streptomyces]|uniref:BatC protein n=1 Tax=Streptomyces noboritoensis TaxID=67337 RepID=A0ABV6TCG6_9ACTN|nr:hypothetical protein [Streptomyces melanogenes]GGP78687.1 hypothetical protein GCM10010278_66450 [Streptomyces melanogenes]
MGRTNGTAGGEQSEEGDIPDTGQGDNSNGQGSGSDDDQMGGGAPSGS